jgi:hypothetical protein
MKRTVQMIIRIASLLASTACLFSLPGWALPQVTLNYEKPFPAILNPGRIIDFVPQSDPVAFGNYVAVIGQQSGSSTNELRVFRMQKLTLENNGTEWDYPYGLNSYTISGAQVTKEVLAPYRQAQPAWWNSSSYAFYSIDAHQGNLIDECFSRSAGTGNQWIGTPVFGKIRRNISGTTIALTVVIALKLALHEVDYFLRQMLELDPCGRERQCIPNTGQLHDLGREIQEAGIATDQHCPFGARTSAEERADASG